MPSRQSDYTPEVQAQLVLIGESNGAMKLDCFLQNMERAVGRSRSRAGAGG